MKNWDEQPTHEKIRRKKRLPDEARKVMCENKQRYTERGATHIKKTILAERGVQVRTYRCPYCHRWHLTKT